MSNTKPKKPSKPAAKPQVHSEAMPGQAHSKTQVSLPKRYKWIFAGHKSMMLGVQRAHAYYSRHPPKPLSEHV